MKKSILFAQIMLLTAIGAQAQNITVRGTVLSKTDDQPLIGASVLSEANKNAAATDIDGKFTLSVPKGSKLTVSYVGYLPTTVLAESEMTIYLAENSELLDEVVVIGYQTIRKADLTGAVAVMNLKEPISENSGNIMNSLAGKMPGVNVVPDAAPGGTGSIRVRGMSTANSSNDPLYIIDGVPTDNINMINPADIESMQVLKDAASASIYGSRAANGVVIITTKQGAGDRMTINVNYAVSAQTIAKRYEMLKELEYPAEPHALRQRPDSGSTALCGRQHKLPHHQHRLAGRSLPHGMDKQSHSIYLEQLRERLGDVLAQLHQPERQHPGDILRTLRSPHQLSL